MKILLFIYNTPTDKELLNTPCDCHNDPLFTQLTDGHQDADSSLFLIIDIDNLSIDASYIVNSSSSKKNYSLSTQITNPQGHEIEIVNWTQLNSNLLTHKPNFFVNLTRESDVMKTLQYQTMLSGLSKLCPQISPDINFRTVLRCLPKTPTQVHNIYIACQQVVESLTLLAPQMKYCNTTNDVDNEIRKSLSFFGYEGYAYPIIITQSHELHPPLKNERINPNKFILIDLGTKVNGFCSDVSRTYPPTGKFTNIQADIYEIVLGAYKHSLSKVREGIMKQDIHKCCYEYLAEKLYQYGLFESITSANIGIGQLMPHSVGHDIGVNVHDPSRESGILMSGDTITIEPGLYFPDKHINMSGINSQLYQRIQSGLQCIRLEDTIVVTENGYYNLTNFPMEISDLEKMFYSGSS